MKWRLSSLRAFYKALERSDRSQRWSRIRREVWCTENLTFQSSFTVDHSLESSYMESEARATFVDGHFISALVLAVSFCEHTLNDWLYLFGVLPDLPKKKPTLEVLAKKAQEAGLFDEQFWRDFTHLKEVRNAYVHRHWDADIAKADDIAQLSKHTLTARVKSLCQHPTSIMEGDAKAALQLMDQIRHLRHRSGITRHPLAEAATHSVFTAGAPSRSCP